MHASGVDWYDAQKGEHDLRVQKGLEHIDREVLQILEITKKLQEQPPALQAGGAGAASMPNIFATPDGRQVLQLGSKTCFLPADGPWSLSHDPCLTCSSDQ